MAIDLLPKDEHGCPRLFLAPMEGLGDRCFRKSMASIGGFDEGVTDFIRVPSNAHVKSLAKVYDHRELSPIPLAAQIMGADAELMACMAAELERRGAPRIDLNCGCPSNTVTGRGAGSSLLKTPDRLNAIAEAIVKAVSVPVTIKMRSGYEDLSLFRENLLAAQQSGVKFITLHPRTKADGYGPPAKWELIAEAKALLSVPVVGNGDILTVEDALRMIRQTRCDALMIGRGAVINPFIFHEIRSHYSRGVISNRWASLRKYFEVYLGEMPKDLPLRNKINKLKQIMSFMFRGREELLEKRSEMLKAAPDSFEAFFEYSMSFLKTAYSH